MRTDMGFFFLSRFSVMKTNKDKDMYGCSSIVIQRYVHLSLSLLIAQQHFHDALCSFQCRIKVPPLMKPLNWQHDCEALNETLHKKDHNQTHLPPESALSSILACAQTSTYTMHCQDHGSVCTSLCVCFPRLPRNLLSASWRKYANVLHQKRAG